MSHDEARLLLSARADGEDHDAATLDAHLATCEDCRAYDSRLARLSTLTAALPREKAPDLRTPLARRIRRRRVLRYAPALAAATAAAVALTVLPAGDVTFPAPDAAAAEPLRTLRSLYLERTVTGPDGTTVERIWFRAPASVRIERVVNGVPQPVRIETPGLVYADGVLTRNAPPTIPLPEPLSPTALLLGTDTGPGPVIAGRPTRRVELRVSGERRIAYVDTERAVALGGDEMLVLEKLGTDVTKRVTRVDRDPVIPDDLFAPPRDAGPPTDGGFRVRRLGALGIEPDALPEGFVPVLTGSGPGGESALFADGSLPLLVTTRPTTPTGNAVEATTATRGDRVYLVTLDLYAAPTVEFLRDGVSLKVTAPLPVESLLDLADRMYPAE